MEENINIQRGGTPVQTQQPQQTTSTFNFPTQVISLPSEGKVYAESNPLSKGTLEIKYLTAREEDILADSNLINKGVVLDKLLESVVVQVGVNADDLVTGDKNAVYLAARVLGYGPEYDVEITDPFSSERQKVSIDLTKIQTKDIDYSLLNTENRYAFLLPSQTKIIFKLLTHKDEKDITNEINALARLTKGKGGSSEVTTRLKYMILSVNDNSDRGYVNNWVSNQFLAKDIQAFRAYVKSISPDLNMKFEFISDVTGESEALDIPFGINFFYPASGL
jgi:hypothetical protein